MSRPDCLEVTGVLQNYAWGKHGLESEAGKLYAANKIDFVAEPDKPYAELWFGTHPKGPSTIKKNGELLNTWIQKHSEFYGRNSNLPFLLKVLSVETALSIQIHPNKVEAITLHAKYPKHYPDDNHKPEMAIALTPFEALCGFRLWHEIIGFIEEIKELRDLVGCFGFITEKVETSLLKSYFTALMSQDEEYVKIQSSSWSNKIKTEPSLSSKQIHQLFLRLNSQYPGDVGCFCVYFLNYLILEPGQSIFLESGLPHAYIKGDCVECMACSDNVIRAGLTPKFRDVESLCRLVKYSFVTPSDVLFMPSRHSSDPHLAIYNPPTPEFSVDRIELPSKMESYTVSSVASPSILLVIQGTFEVFCKENLKATKGSALFVGPNEALKIKNCDANSPVLMFRAYFEI